VLSIVPVGSTMDFEAIPPPPAHYYEISEADTEHFSLIINLSAASETTTEIDSMFRSEPLEDRPTKAVAEAAIRMIWDADTCSPMYLAASEIESFEGDLLVHWTIRGKRVTLISSNPDGHVKLYKSGSSHLSELIPNPSAKDLVIALNSLMQ
jgi:hypothetical protein